MRTRHKVQSILTTIAIAAMGAFAATALGLPAGVLVGATLAVAMASWANVTLLLPIALRNMAFAALGMTLGSGITPDLLSDMARWPLALVILPVALIAMTLAALTVLRLCTPLRGPTALLATSPGALSYALALAEDRAGDSAQGRAINTRTANARPADLQAVDTQAVAGLQSLRLVMITVLLPPIVAWFNPDTGGANTTRTVAVPGIGIATSLALLCAALALGWVLARLRLPAAWLFGGFLVSLFAHVAGFVEGRPFEAVTVAAFVLIGALVGLRFGASIAKTDLARLIGAGVVATILATGTAALLAWPVASALDLPFGQVWVAYAPGGVEAMAAIGFALGYDPVFIALHHIARLLLLAVALPLLLATSGRRNA